MARRKRTENFTDVPAKTMRRKKPINSDHLINIEPLTENQEKVFEAYANNKNLFLCGSAGTGKTFITIYLALKEILSATTPYEKLYIVRSLVPTREIGFLPGSHDDKASLYQIPYKNMVKHMFKMSSEDAFEVLYENLKTQETISFWSTSFLRGVTLDNAIILIDECQNLTFHELDSIITRVGIDSKIIFCGDTAQSDLLKQYERTGAHDFIKIVHAMESFEMVEFGIQDVCRSGLVKEYLIAKHNMGLNPQ
jgi:predicted ribonuclease YlaK